MLLALYLFHRGVRRVMHWMAVLLLAFSLWAFIGYAGGMR